jgi:hypothetical protein
MRINNTYPIDRAGRSHWRIEERSILAALSVCGILTLGIYLSTSWASSHGNGAFWSFGSSAEAPQPPVHTPPFQLSGIQIGMTPLEAGSVQPEILFSRNRKGGQTGRFRLGNGAYTVSFSKPEAGQQAYRIHYTETFWSFSGVQIRQRLKNKFGAPVVNRCAMENPNVGWVCELKWQRPDGVILDAVTQTAEVARGLSKTKLEFVALNPLMESRNSRPAETKKNHPPGAS